MAGPRDRRSRGKPPPGQNAEVAPIGHRHHSKSTPTVGATLAHVVPGVSTECDKPDVAAEELSPRRWAHDQESCSTCVIYAEMTDRRRRAEIAGLKRAQRIIDLTDESDPAWISAHAAAHAEWQRYRETGR